MEFNISDLLDDYQDSSVQLQEQPVASASRIKELTMKKIHTQNKEPRKGLGLLGRIALVAAIVMALASTVMAATGFHFSDWFSADMMGSDYDQSVTLGSDSMCWHVGNRVIQLSAEKETPTGATIVSDDLSPQGANELTVGAEYWLEKWDESKYVRMETLVKNAEWSEENRTLPILETASWEINWEDLYGELTDGHYRIGMTFAGTNGTGEMEEVVCYAKFRVYQEEMGEAINKCLNAIESLCSQESYHTTFYWYGWDGAEFRVISDEVWKSGDDYLGYHEYHRVTEEAPSVSGRMLRDGVAYGLEWEAADPESQVSAWEIMLYDVAYDYVDWDWMLDPSGATTGEVFVDGNVTTVLKSTGCAGLEYAELTYTFDDAGNLKSIVRKNLPLKDCAEEEKELEYMLEVHDTAASECERFINAQDVTTPNVFSWAEDQDANPDAKRSGFVNTTAQPIGSAMEAVERAKNDTTMTTEENSESHNSNRYYHTIYVYYDESADMWKVVFSFPQNDRNYQAIYMTGDGITKMIVDLTGTA